MTTKISPEMVAQLVRDALELGAQVEIDGLGTFRRDGREEFVFIGRSQPKVFIAYVVEDAVFANRLYDAFAAHGFDPWLDRRKLLPGQNWPRAIEDALETTDFVVACFSSHSVRKRGGFQAEIRYALDCMTRLPLEDVFLVPLRLDACEIPTPIRKVVQYVDLFPDFYCGFRRILNVLKKEWKRKAA